MRRPWCAAAGGTAATGVDERSRRPGQAPARTHDAWQIPDAEPPAATEDCRVGGHEVDGLGVLLGSEQVVVLPQVARTFVFRHQRPPENMQIRIAAVESLGRPALVHRRVYRLQPKAGSVALPEFASCSTVSLGCFVMQTYGTSIHSPAAPPHPHGNDYLVINPSTGRDVSWPPPQLLDDEGLDRFAHPLQPTTAG